MPLNDEELAQVAAGKMMLQLVEHPAWKLYTEVLQTRIDNVKLLLEVPVTSMTEALQQNYQKGTVSGLRLALEMPAYTVAEMKTLQETAQAVEEEEDDSDAS